MQTLEQYKQLVQQKLASDSTVWLSEEAIADAVNANGERERETVQGVVDKLCAENGWKAQYDFTKAIYTFQRALPAQQ